jgi:pyruvate,orthophosphate dikinase
LVQIGVAGVHAGEPVSIAFLDRIGVDYLVCSPYELPAAKVAAAQATIRAELRKALGLL